MKNKRRQIKKKETEQNNNKYEGDRVDRWKRGREDERRSEGEGGREGGEGIMEG